VCYRKVGFRHDPDAIADHDSSRLFHRMSSQRRVFGIAALAVLATVFVGVTHDTMWDGSRGTGVT
jgi:hypothetical protein